MTTTKKLDLVLINPGSRTQVYQSLGTQAGGRREPGLGRPDGDVLPPQGLSVEIIDAEAEELIARRGRRARPGPEPGPGRRRRLRPSAVGLDADHDRLRPGLHGDQADYRRSSRCCWSAATSPPCRSAPCAKRTPISSPPARDCTRWSAWSRRSKTPAPDFGQACPACGIAQDGQPRHTPDEPLVADLDGDMPGLGLGPAADEPYRAHNWHCLGGLDRQPYAALYTTLGCPYHCSFCCIQAPFKSGEAGGGVRKESRQQLPLLEPRHGHRADRPAGRIATASATSRSPTRCSS